MRIHNSAILLACAAAVALAAPKTSAKTPSIQVAQHNKTEASKPTGNANTDDESRLEIVEDAAATLKMRETAHKPGKHEAEIIAMTHEQKNKYTQKNDEDAKEVEKPQSVPSVFSAGKIVEVKIDESVDSKTETVQPLIPSNKTEKAKDDGLVVRSHVNVHTEDTEVPQKSNVSEEKAVEEPEKSGKGNKTDEAAPSLYIAEQEIVKGDTRQFGAIPHTSAFNKLALTDAKEIVTYEGFKVYYVQVESRKQEKYLSDIKNENTNISFWNDPKIDYNTTFIAPKECSKKIEEGLKEQDITYRVLTDNLQSWFDEERKGINPELFLANRNLDNFLLNSYHQFDEISGFIDALVEKYPDFVKPLQIGTTYEGNPIKGAKISKGAAGKPIVYIDAGTHAREWISVSTAVFLLHTLATKADTDSQVKNLLEHFEFHIIPVINPDGYKFTFNGNRLWRKNRVRFDGYYWCAGVDPNRNYGFYWGGPGADSTPCGETYRGPHALSEAESIAVAQHMRTNKDKVALYLSLHAYGQMLLLPYGAGPQKISKDYQSQYSTALAFTNAIHKFSGSQYTAGTTLQLLYPASGLSNDYVHSLGIKHAYVAELRDRIQGYGFALPASQIIPTAEETFVGIKAMIYSIARNDLNIQLKL